MSDLPPLPPFPPPPPPPPPPYPPVPRPTLCSIYSEKLAGPAYAMIVLAAIGIGVDLYFFKLFIEDYSYVDALKVFHTHGGELVEPYFALFAHPVVLFIVLLLYLCMMVFVIIYANDMRHANNYRKSIVAAIITTVPIFSPCCCLGTCIGIWALIVLSKAEIKEIFSDA